MNGATVPLSGNDWLALFGHFATLSMFSVGGAITVASDMHRILVGEHGWLSDEQFSASIALAQAAPGPNVLFVGLFGWHVGLNSGGYVTAVMGLMLSLLGMLLPSSALNLLATRWARRHREDRAVIAFKQGMAPVVIGMMLATAAVLDAGYGRFSEHWSLWLISTVTTAVVWRTRIHLLWLLGAGAMLGAMGWV